MLKIAISGCNGKMGQVLSGLSLADPEIQVLWGLDIHETPSAAYPVYTLLQEDLPLPDVLIDFSHPDVLEQLLVWAVARHVPCVIATTGISDSQKDLLRHTAMEIPVFYSANMSLGVNVVIDIVKRITRVLEEKFDIEIVEKHHNQKVDAPSGTALAIADAINEVLSVKQEYIYDRHSRRKKRGRDEIGIHAVRGGTIVGEHSIIYAGNDEIIEIKHTALSKIVFAEGAMKAARFLAGRSPGYYSMKDMMNP